MSDDKMLTPSALEGASAAAPQRRDEYTVTFERIGRNRDVPALTVTIEDSDNDALEQLSDAIHEYARKYLRSSDYGVLVNYHERRGYITCGFRPGGEFSFVLDEPRGLSAGELPPRSEAVNPLTDTKEGG